MLHKFFQSSFWMQVFLVALFAFTTHVFMRNLSMNIVMRFYCLGGQNFLQGKDPYKSTEQYGHANSFKYSPQFALLAGGIARVLPPATYDMRSKMETQGYLVFEQSPNQQPRLYLNRVPALVLGLWVMAGTTLFALGLIRWCRLSMSAPLYVIFAFLSAMLDLVISMGAYQINAVTIGLMLLGLAEYRDKRYYTAGAFLVLAANLKIYPVIFLAALLLRFRWKFLAGAFICGIVILILPAFWVGWSHNLDTHVAWVKTVLQVSRDERILDIVSSFERVGLAWLGVALDKVVFVASLVVLFAYAAFSKRMDWRPWMAFGMAATLLVSPRSEVYTYVMLAPAYLYLFYWSRESEIPFIKKFGSIIVTILAVACASCRFTDPTWYYSQTPMEIIRVLCSLGFWIFTGTVLSLSLHERYKEWRGGSRGLAKPA